MRETKLNIIVGRGGVERISIFGGINLTLEAMQLYRTIAPDVIKIDEKIKSEMSPEKTISGVLNEQGL